VKNLFFVLACALCWVGCDKVRSLVDKKGSSETKACFNCSGTGKTKCVAPGCKAGKVECPGPCIKLTQGVWEHKHVDGHPDSDIWLTFNGADGSWKMVNQNHAGQVMELRNGRYELGGKCKTCGGAAKIKCPICQGTSQTTCSICDGHGVVPADWTAFNNPKINNRPNLIRLKDGRAIFGKVEMRIGTMVYIKTEDGKQQEIKAEDIASGVENQ
jgi:hypothetical protein